MKHQHNYMHDAQHCTPAQLQERYSIEIDEDGVVWDPYEMQEFDNVYAWARYMEEQEEEQSKFEKIGSRHKFDDDEDY